MPTQRLPAIVILAVCLTHALALRADEKAPYACASSVDHFFVNEVWAKVGAQTCLECHHTGGDAEDSEFILRDPRKSQGHAQDEVLKYNRDQFAKMAKIKEGADSRMLLKVIGKLKHGGKQALKPDSAGYRVLAELVRRSNDPSSAAIARVAAEDKAAPPFFDGIVMLDDRRLLRRVTLQLAARLPTEAELATIASQGRKALPAILDALMQEDAVDIEQARAVAEVGDRVFVPELVD